MTPEEYKWMRHEARTNLYYLCTRVLGYTDVCKRVHGKVVKGLQKFVGGWEGIEQVTKDRCRYYPGSYKPYVDKWDLLGSRKNLILYPRGHLKTTVATIAHKIQWIINYPDIRILLSSGTGDQVKGFLREMKAHFQMNEAFRFLFPEFCPHKNVKEFGNQESFTVPCRTIERKEPTVGTTSVGAVVASAHYDVIDNDDVVDKENVRTPEQIANVRSHLGYLWPLLETAPDADKRPTKYQRGWWDLVGTRYDFSDAYGTVIDEEEKKETKTYQILEQSALVEGELSRQECHCKEIEGKHEVIDHAKSLWPERLPPRALLEIAEDPLQGWGVLASQYFMNPVPDKSGLVDSPDDIVWIPTDQMKKIYAYLSLHVTVDLAGMEPSTNKLADNDYTVINLHGFGHDGTLFIVSILRGRYTPFEVIDLLFKLAALHPRLMDIKVEKEAHARVLLPFLKREMAKRGRWLPVVEIRRDNRTSKQQRIKGLQPWFRNGSIKFADNQPHKLGIINEIMRFPKYAHDDILDTIADAMQNREGGITSDVLPMGKAFADAPPGRLLATGERVDIPARPMYSWEMYDQQQVQESSTLDPMTGW